MKRFLILTLPEHESAVQEGLQKTVFQHTNQTGYHRIERLRLRDDLQANYKVLSFRINDTCLDITERETFETSDYLPSMMELRELTANPKKIIGDVVAELENKQRRLEKARLSLEEAKAKLIDIRSKLRILGALKPEELKECIAVGVIRVVKVRKLGFAETPRLEEHLLRYKDISFRMVEISPEEEFLFVFGPEERRSWVEALLLVFDVKDIFDVLSVRDILLALDPTKREESLKGYEEQVEALQKYVDSEEEVRQTKSEIAPILAQGMFIQRLLSFVTNNQEAISEAKTVSILEGQIPKEKALELRSFADDLKKKLGLSLHVMFEKGDFTKQAPEI